MDAMDDTVVTELLSMSLDDIAAKRRAKGHGSGHTAGRGAARDAGKVAPARGAGGVGGRTQAATTIGGRGAGGGRSGGVRASNGAVSQQARSAAAPQGGGAVWQRNSGPRQGNSGGGGGGGGNGSGPVRRGAAIGKQARAAAAPYTHEAPATRKPPIYQRLGAKAAQGHKVAVSNLNFDVMQEDLEDLFAGLGKVLDLKMKYDRSGRSLGEAVVTFELRGDAAKAVRELHTRTLDGTPMHLRLLDGAAEASAAGGGAAGGRNRSYSDPGEERPRPRKQAAAAGGHGSSNVREGVFGTAMADLASNSNAGTRGRGASDVHFKVTLDSNRNAGGGDRRDGGRSGGRASGAGRGRSGGGGGGGGFGGHVGGGFGGGRGQGRGSRGRPQQQHSAEDLDADLADWKGN